MKTKIIAIIFGIVAFWGCEKGTEPKQEQPKRGQPEILSLTANPSSIEIGETTVLTCNATDPDNWGLSYKWEANSGSISGSDSSITWTAPYKSGTYAVYCTVVNDGTDREDIQNVNIQVNASTIDNFHIELIVEARNGLVVIDSTGKSSYLIFLKGCFELLNDQIFVLENGIKEFNRQGILLNSILMPREVNYLYNFTILPDSKFALLDNYNYKIYFINSQGDHLITVDVFEQPVSSGHKLEGIVVGNSLILAEGANNQLLKINLQTYEVSIFKDLSNLTGWLGPIEYSDGVYYFCLSNNIYSFIEGQNETLISTLPERTITGMVVVGNYAFVTVYNNGRIYKVSLSSGQCEIFAEWLNYPKDIEIW